MKHRKPIRILSALLALALLLAIAPQLSLAAHAAETSGECGEHLTWSFDEATGTLTISGYGEMDDFYVYDEYDEDGNILPYSSTIPWHDYVAKITGVRLPDGLTYIGANAFLNCTGLKSAVIPVSVTHIGFFSFSGCSSLQSVTIPDGVTCIDQGGFFRCTSLQSVTIPKSVISLLNNAFSECSGLQSVALSDGLIYIDTNVFSDCSSLRSVTIPDSVTYIGDNAFCGCRSLQSVTISNGVRCINYSTFADCVSLQSVTIPDGVKRIKDNAFSNCFRLKQITIPDSVKRIGTFVFDGTALLTDPNNWAGGFLYLDNWLIQAEKGITRAAIRPGTIGIADIALADIHALQSVTIPEGVESIGEGAFCACDQLGSVEIPSSVRFIGVNAFEDTAYENNKNNWLNGLLYMDNWLLAADPKISAAIIRPGTRGIADNVFEFYINLTAATLPEGLRFIGDRAFHYCENLSRIAIPNSVESIGELAFADCYSLESVSVSSSLTSIERCAFEGCFYLADLTIPDGVTSIDDRAFNHCHSITRLVIPESVTSIGRQAFSGSASHITVLLILNKDCAIHEGTESLGNPDTTILYGYPGSTTEAYAQRYGYLFRNIEEIPFFDVTDEAYYAEPVAWAVERGVTNGTSPHIFSPEATCTRAQVVTFLWRAAGSPEPRSNANPFTDVAANQYYHKAVLWAVENGVTTGTSADKFSPDSGCTRAQVVTFLWRAEGKPAPVSTANPFTDVKLGEYYGQAVLWAVEKGVTKGTAADRFSPASTCTRGQIVTFLYRAMS